MNYYKKTIIQGLSTFLILFFTMSFSLKSQNILTIEIRNLKNNTGKVLIEIRGGKNNFIKGISADIVKQTSVITIDSLNEGEYSFKFFHDENNNKKLDVNLIGIPKEGFGFSNNAKGTFGPPAFKKTIFKLKGGVIQKCTPLYY